MLAREATVLGQQLSLPAVGKQQFGRAVLGCGGVRQWRQGKEGSAGQGHSRMGLGVQGPPVHLCCGWLPPRTPAWLTICWLLHMTSPLSCPPWLRDKTSVSRRAQSQTHPFNNSVGQQNKCSFSAQLKWQPNNSTATFICTTTFKHSSGLTGKAIMHTLCCPELSFTVKTRAICKIGTVCFCFF